MDVLGLLALIVTIVGSVASGVWVLHKSLSQIQDAISHLNLQVAVQTERGLTTTERVDKIEPIVMQLIPLLALIPLISRLGLEEATDGDGVPAHGN